MASTDVRRSWGNVVGVVAVIAGCLAVVGEAIHHRGTAIALILDTRPGIPTAEVHRLFEPFSQGATQPTHGKGLGLGLAIAKGIVTSHAGRIWAEASPLGATFVVELPVIEGQASARVSAQVAPRLDGLRLLYVEDQRDIGEGMRAALESLGAEVEFVETYEHAVAALARTSFEAVLSDINLGPGPGGLELVRAVPASQGRGRPLLVALSAYGTSRDHEAAREAGYAALLVKPADLATVAFALQAARRR